MGLLRSFGPTLALVLSLTACGATGTVKQPATQTASNTPQPSAGQAESSQPSSRAIDNSRASSSPASSAPIKVGLILPLTGPVATLAKDNRDGFELFLSSINNTVAGRRLNVITVDTQGQPDVAVTKAKQLVENEHVQLLAGMVITGVCYAIAGYIKTAQVPTAVTGGCAAQKLTIDPKFANPYMIRLSEMSTQINDPFADWSIKQGYRKAIMITKDNAGGIESSDAFGRAFVDRGGQVVQELYPPQGTSDFGPYLAQLNNGGDIIYGFLPGADGLHFMQQYGQYASQRKAQLLDSINAMTDGPNLDQIKDNAVGVIASNEYTVASNTPENKAFLAAWHQQYPGRPVSTDAAKGYAAAQFLVAALKKIDGNVEQKQRFLEALYTTEVTTVKGPVKLDKFHDIVQNVYIYQIVKDGDGYGQKVLATYESVSQNWDLTPEVEATFPFGGLKGKWVGMTKTKLEQIPKS